LSNPAQAKASKNYICSCGCGKKILIGQQVVVHMGDFYAVGHYFSEDRCEATVPMPAPVWSPQTAPREPMQMELQLF